MSRRRVYLHVGTPKSGTSYLQDKLALNRDELERQGLEYLRTRTGDHFEAALDLIGERWAGEEKSARGQWEALAQDARKSRRNVLVSHEILAAAGPESVARAMASFPTHEVHVIVTARDLGRQIPAEWQERVKHRGGRDYTNFLKTLMRSYRTKDQALWFWKVQHLPRILATWGKGLPPGPRPPGHGAAGRRATRRAVEAVRRRARPEPACVVRRERDDQRLARWGRGDHAAPPERRAGRAEGPADRLRQLGPRDHRQGGPGAASRTRCRRRFPRSDDLRSKASPPSGSRRFVLRGSTSSALSTTSSRSGRTAASRGPTPTGPTRTPSRTPPSRRSRTCSRGSDSAPVTDAGTVARLTRLLRP